MESRCFFVRGRSGLYKTPEHASSRLWSDYLPRGGSGEGYFISLGISCAATTCQVPRRLSQVSVQVSLTSCR
jgi:hypothetical protein